MSVSVCVCEIQMHTISYVKCGGSTSACFVHYLPLAFSRWSFPKLSHHGEMCLFSSALSALPVISRKSGCDWTRWTHRWSAIDIDVDSKVITASLRGEETSPWSLKCFHLCFSCIWVFLSPLAILKTIPVSKSHQEMPVIFREFWLAGVTENHIHCPCQKSLRKLFLGFLAMDWEWGMWQIIAQSQLQDRKQRQFCFCIEQHFNLTPAPVGNEVLMKDYLYIFQPLMFFINSKKEKKNLQVL